jgi:hypothetical protein
MLLIFPPVAKPGEPPAGIAKLAGALSLHGVPVAVLDANIEGMLFLLGGQLSGKDTWTRRAVKNAAVNLAALRNPATYGSIDRYRRAVMDVNRVLEMSGSHEGVAVSLVDYQDRKLSPVRSADLIEAAEHPERNPFYPWFSRRLAELPGASGSPQSRGGREEIKSAPPGKGRSNSIVGFSLNYLSQALCAFSMIGFIKKEFPEAEIVLGGGLVTSWMKRPGWRNCFSGLVDHLIAGPGEGPLLEIAGIMDAKKHSTPSYGLLPVSDYLSPGFILPYSGSSGCFWNKCSFCPETAENNPYLPVSPQDSIDDLGSICRSTSPILIHLLDNSIRPALMSALAGTSLGVPWYGFARIGKELADYGFCTALKQSGCVMLKLGLESGDQGVLDRLHKGVDLETASHALKNLHRAGIATYVYLLFGTPAETLAEARKTLSFVTAHGREITYLNLAIFNMPVCSRDAAQYETQDFYEGDLSLYTGFKHPHGWGRKEVRRFLDTEFKRHPVIATMVKRDPPLFTSNHAAVFRKGMFAAHEQR